MKLLLWEICKVVESSPTHTIIRVHKPMSIPSTDKTRHRQRDCPRGRNLSTPAIQFWDSKAKAEDSEQRLTDKNVHPNEHAVVNYLRRYFIVKYHDQVHLKRCAKNNCGHQVCAVKSGVKEAALSWTAPKQQEQRVQLHNSSKSREL